MSYLCFSQSAKTELRGSAAASRVRAAAAEVELPAQAEVWEYPKSTVFPVQKRFPEPGEPGEPEEPGESGEPEEPAY